MAKTKQRSRGAVVPSKAVKWKSDEEMLATLEKVRGELRLEGIELTEEETQLIAQRAREGWSDEEFTRRALELARR